MHLPSTMRPLAVAAQAAVLFFAFARIFSAPQGAHAQQTDAVCLSNFSWMENSRGQNPCLVAAYVQGVCNGGQWRVGALSPGRHYIGPYREDADNCQCSSVVYDLVSACGLCQNRIIIAWSTWATNCTTDLQTLGGFPNPIPSGTSIPAWAYLNPVDHNDLFDPDAAQALVSQPESSAPPQASGTRSSSRSPSGTGINAPSISPSSGGGGGSNVGAIVGGVVGGLVGVGLIAVLAFFLLRKKKATAQQNQFTPYQAPQPPLTPYGDQPLMANYQPSSPGGFPNGNNGMYSPPPPSSMQPPFGSDRLYDPNDPSTFPATSSTPVSNMGGHSVHTTYGQPQPARPGQYTGVPEL